jgi:hypothetical protein
MPVAHRLCCISNPRRGGRGVEKGGDASPFISPDCEAVAAQRRWRDGLVPASPSLTSNPESKTALSS